MLLKPIKQQVYIMYLNANYNQEDFTKTASTSGDQKVSEQNLKSFHLECINRTISQHEGKPSHIYFHKRKTINLYMLKIKIYSVVSNSQKTTQQKQSGQVYQNNYIMTIQQKNNRFLLLKFSIEYLFIFPSDLYNNAKSILFNNLVIQQILLKVDRISYLIPKDH
ncbi:hypothetical protein pb186bvf_018201 [Paramecium bursaria]